MDKQVLVDSFNRLVTLGQSFTQEMGQFQNHLEKVGVSTVQNSDGMHHLTVFILACFVGYYVVWRVTPALHAPLMSVTNAISSVIVVGALLAVFSTSAHFLGYLALIAASINIFGGFVMTRRMLSMLASRKK